MDNIKQKDSNLDQVARALMTIDSSIRNGQFLYAYREANKLLSEIIRNEYKIDSQDSILLQSSIKRTVLFLRQFVKVYSQNQSSLEIVRKALKCNQTKPKQ